MSLKDVSTNLGRNRRIAVLLVLLLFVGIVALVIVLYKRNEAYNTKTYASISNYNQQGLPSENKPNIEIMLRRLLANRFDITDETKITARIRDNSLLKFDEYYSFLVDVDEYKQTYRATISIESPIAKNKNISKDSDGIVLSCPKKKEKKYPDSPCIGMYNDDSDPNIYLPYYGTTSNGKEYTAKLRLNDGKPTIGLYVVDCGEQKYLEEAKKLATKHLSEDGMDLSKYTFKTIDVCTSHNGF